MTKAQKAEQAQWIENLRGRIKPGDTVYTVLRSVSRSGMSRRIDLYLLTEDGPSFITGMVASVLGMRWDRDKGGIITNGCGMDMGFHLVYNLSSVLFRDGFGCIGDGTSRKTHCPSNDHSNGDHDYTSHATYLHDKAQHEKMGKAPTIEPHWHRDGGYALRQEWI